MSDRSKSKTFADATLKADSIHKFVINMVVNFVLKGENAGNKHFLSFLRNFFKSIL